MRWILCNIVVVFITACGRPSGSATVELIPSPAPAPTEPPSPVVMHQPTETPEPTPEPTPALPPPIQPLPPPSFNNCQADPNAAVAPNYPVYIVQIDESAETVTLKNVSPEDVDLTGWRMCSISGNQEHPISGALAAYEEKVFSGPAGNIWSNSERDDGALYNPDGQLVSYRNDS
jgi:hypothetical protein